MEYSLQALNKLTKLQGLKLQEIVDTLNLIGLEVDNIFYDKSPTNNYIENLRIEIAIPSNREDLLNEKFLLTELSTIFKVAGYTYGPLLGLYLLGIFTKVKVKDNLVPYICVAMPFLTYYLNYYFIATFSFDLGFMNILVNAMLTILCLIIIKKQNDKFHIDDNILE